MSGLLHYAAALVATITLMAIWRSAFRFIGRDMLKNWWDRPICAFISAIPPAIVAFAAFVLGARL